MAQGKIQVCGHKIFNKPASSLLRHLAFGIDFCFVLIFSAMTIKASGILPTPGIYLAGFLIPLGSLYWFPQKLLFGVTFGDRIWQLKSNKNGDHPSREVLFQRNRISHARVFGGSLVITVGTLLTFSALHEAFLVHPIWLTGSRWNLEPFSPSTEGVKGKWLTAPFFYTLGAWPKTFDGKIASYFLTYEKGPPHHFVGQIVSKWSPPDITLIIEGPKTPHSSGPQENQNRLKTCFSSKFSYSCLNSRTVLLSRHLKEAELIHPNKWEVRWFTVNNPMIPPEEQAQGVYFQASSIGQDSPDGRIQDRFILINSEGTQQTILLNRPDNHQGEVAFNQLLKTIRSMRISAELNSHRNWIRQQLEGVHLQDNSTSVTPDLANLAEIQSLLISKISVLPQSFESYLHLGGLSVVILKTIMKSSRENLTSEQSSLAASSVKNIEGIYKYTSDIAPNDPRTEEALRLWKQTENLKK